MKKTSCLLPLFLFATLALSACDKSEKSLEQSTAQQAEPTVIITENQNVSSTQEAVATEAVVSAPQPLEQKTEAVEATLKQKADELSTQAEAMVADASRTTKSTIESVSSVPAEKIAESTTQASNAKLHIVKMLNSGKDGSMVFEPGFIKIALGDSVKFIATTPGHNTVSKFTPEGASTWKGNIGEEITITPNKEGVYIYQCVPHAVMAMVGVVQVGAASNKVAAEKAGTALAVTFALNKDRLTKYLAQVK